MIGLLYLGNEFVLVAQKLVEQSVSLGEQSLKVISGPLDGVLNLVGEVSQSAHGNSFFRRVD